MKHRYALAIAALAVLAVAMPALADTDTLARAQSWEAFGGTTSKGRGVCGISADPGGHYFGVKIFAGDDRFVVQLGTPEWKQLQPQPQPQQKVPVTMRFDANREWNANGVGFRFDDGDMGLQFYVNRSEIDAFATQFRSSSKLALRFDDSRLPPWILGLEGTADVNGAFQKCVRALK